MPQKNFLFSGDIAQNLNFGKEDGTQADWERAARIACADEFIAKKQKGYHDPIAQGGTNLSGGQRQRMAIARAMMKQPLRRPAPAHGHCPGDDEAAGDLCV